jgi:hypothetical protein
MSFTTLILVINFPKYKSHIEFCIEKKSVDIKLKVMKLNLYQTFMHFVKIGCIALICSGLSFQSLAQEVEVTGAIKIVDGSQGKDKVLTSDADGLATWQLRKTYSVGDFAQGGIVVWVDESRQHGLVLADHNQCLGTRWYAGRNGNTQAKGDGVYAGEMNTAIIISSHVAIGDDGGDYAARLCADLETVQGGVKYGDWYLPSIVELNMIFLNRDLIDQFALEYGVDTLIQDNHWSSTEIDSTKAWVMSFWNGVSYNFTKNGTANKVRAIRSF